MQKQQAPRQMATSTKGKTGHPLGEVNQYLTSLTTSRAGPTKAELMSHRAKSNVSLLCWLVIGTHIKQIGKHQNDQHLYTVSQYFPYLQVTFRPPFMTNTDHFQELVCRIHPVVDTSTYLNIKQLNVHFDFYPPQN